MVSFKGRNCEHLADADSSNAQIQSSSNIRGRESFLRIFRFLKKLKGFENVRIKNVKTEVGVRESFRIDALHNITVDEYVSAKRYPDGVCYSFYHIDLHDDKGARARRLKKGVVPCVPLSALIPKSSKFMIAAGRHVGSDRLANSALRIRPAAWQWDRLPVRLVRCQLEILVPSPRWISIRLEPSSLKTELYCLRLGNNIFCEIVLNIIKF